MVASPSARWARGVRRRCSGAALAAAAAAALLAGAPALFAGRPTAGTRAPSEALREARPGAAPVQPRRAPELARLARGDGGGADVPVQEQGQASRASRMSSRLMDEITGSTPGLARSSAEDPKAPEGAGGVRLFAAPGPRERVDFALWLRARPDVRAAALLPGRHLPDVPLTVADAGADLRAARAGGGRPRARHPGAPALSEGVLPVGCGCPRLPRWLSHNREQRLWGLDHKTSMDLLCGNVTLPHRRTIETQETQGTLAASRVFPGMASACAAFRS
ncbi:unnamed protein product [Prorocentrum cordatum]|uniref:Phospholipase B-like n=1 Tax=Prorocentrum cordatum TaxID=2364126 RepID=A0ABN9TXC6_9DINO|nr:unnamed protein product [Polarella glacialis]